MSILQYLSSYAEPECACPPPEQVFDDVLVIPAFDESPHLLDGLDAACSQSRVLVIIIVNASIDRQSDEKQRTLYLLRALAGGGKELTPGIVLTPHKAGALLVIDRASPGRELPPKQGVGLARKIGCDLALAWHERERIRSPWIHCSDADATLFEDYFAAARALDSQTECVALTYPFWHQCEKTSTSGRALELYEMSLRYYVLGLHWAGSPYAFHCIGSTMAIRAQAYHQVRGVPKRQAGEDFYLLNKLAKLGSVRVPDSAAIRIAQRESHRTPFGTGPRSHEIAELMRSGQDVCVYHPTSFAHLREWLGALTEFATDCDMAVLERLSHPELRYALPLETEDRLREAASQGKTVKARQQRLATWFDGFRTLKLIHALRDQGLADRRYQDAFDAAPFVPEKAEGVTLRETMARREAQLATLSR